MGPAEIDARLDLIVPRKRDTKTYRSRRNKAARR
jgi:hypothetical protein